MYNKDVLRPLNEKLYPFKDHKGQISLLAKKLYTEFRETGIPNHLAQEKERVERSLEKELEDLAVNIKTNGLLEPIVVLKISSDTP